jgi:hypothetical protein
MELVCVFRKTVAAFTQDALQGGTSTVPEVPEL